MQNLVHELVNFSKFSQIWVKIGKKLRNFRKIPWFCSKFGLLVYGKFLKNLVFVWVYFQISWWHIPSKTKLDLICCGLVLLCLSHTAYLHKSSCSISNSNPLPPSVGLVLNNTHAESCSGMMSSKGVSRPDRVVRRDSLNNGFSPLPITRTSSLKYNGIHSYFFLVWKGLIKDIKWRGHHIQPCEMTCRPCAQTWGIQVRVFANHTHGNTHNKELMIFSRCAAFHAQTIVHTHPTNHRYLNGRKPK